MNDQEKPTVSSPTCTALLCCPFCDGEAEVKRMGTNRVSMIIGCVECSCELETGETWIDKDINWNKRAS